VTDRLTPLRIENRVVHQVWLPYHWGASGMVTGDSANDLFGITLDPNVLIQESKVGTCDVRPGRRPTGPALREYVDGYLRRAGLDKGAGAPIVTAPGAAAGNGGGGRQEGGVR
jgi:formate dehydrogenase major subunit